MTSRKEKEKLSSDRAASQLSLLDVRVRRVYAELLHPVQGLPLEISSQTIRPSLVVATDYVIYDLSYAVTGHEVDVEAGDEKYEDIVTLEARLYLTFGWADKVPNVGSLKAFGAHGALSIAHPFVRELFSNLTVRMGLPPLLLDVDASTYIKPTAASLT